MVHDGPHMNLLSAKRYKVTFLAYSRPDRIFIIHLITLDRCNLFFHSIPHLPKKRKKEHFFVKFTFNLKCQLIFLNNYDLYVFYIHIYRLL